MNLLAGMKRKIESVVNWVVTNPGLVISVIGLAIGRGVILQMFTSPSLHYVVQQQLVTDSVTLNACTIRNKGGTIASNVHVQVWSEENLLFHELSVTGAEGLWDIQPASVITDHAHIHLDRLVSTHILTVTVSTDSPITFRCKAAADNGPAQPPEQVHFRLTVWDFILLLIVQCTCTIVAILASRNSPTGEQVT